MDLVPRGLNQTGRTSPFLLCNGDAEIFSRFEFPKPVHVGGEGAGQVVPSTVSIELPGYSSDLADVLEPMLLDFDLDILDDIFNPDQPMDDAIDWTADFPILSPEQDSFGVLHNEAKLSALASHILESASNAGKPDPERFKVLTTLKHLLAPAQAHRALSRYFESWHRICRIIHRPTFTADTAPDVVLVAVLMLGAMYLSNEEDREKTLSVIDFVEDYVFSQEPSPLDAVARTDTDIDETPRFHFLQAAFLIVVTQYWTGSDCSRRRVSKVRFDRVIETARQLGSFGVTHTADDRKSQASWLARERHIRTSTWVTLLDCAFLFFWGIPTRIAGTQIRCDLPCDEAIFDEENPFTHSSFAFSRGLTAKSAFQALFKNADRLPLTMLDTFVLIHLLYRFASDALAIQLWRSDGAEDKLPLPEIGSDLMVALDCWHRHWERLQSDATESDIWNGFGFWKHGDQYEYAIRLLLSERARPHLSNLLEIEAPRLERLKGLNPR